MNELTNAIISLAGLGIIGYLVFWKHQECETDRFRSSLFKIRNRLFDSAVAGDLEFDSKAYQYLRTSINGYIRFAHLMNVYQLFLFSKYSKNKNFSSSKNKFESVLVGLSKEQIAIVKEYHSQVMGETVKHLLLTSPFVLVALAIPLVPVVSIQHFWTGIQKRLEKDVSKIEVMVTQPEVQCSFA